MGTLKYETVACYGSNQRKKDWTTGQARIGVNATRTAVSQLIATSSLCRYNNGTWAEFLRQLLAVLEGVPIGYSDQTLSGKGPNGKEFIELQERKRAVRPDLRL